MAADGPDDARKAMAGTTVRYPTLPRYNCGHNRVDTAPKRRHAVVWGGSDDDVDRTIGRRRQSRKRGSLFPAPSAVHSMNLSSLD
jgi:hypothetical protein